MEKILSAEADHSMELYDFLRLRMGLTKRQIRQLKFRENGIRVEGQQRRVTYRLRPGELVEVLLEDESNVSSQLILTDRPLVILYEDEDICIVNKPAGVPTHPGGNHYQDTVANMMMCYFFKKGVSLRIRPIGRLDRETSGALLFAKNQAAAGRLVKQRERRLLRKEYLAVASGHFPQTSGTIDARLRKLSEKAVSVCWAEDGKTAVTHYQVLREHENFTVLRIRLETGRMHQIRAHMAGIGHPLLGDRLYGGDTSLVDRTALHAWKLSLRQPFTGAPVSVLAEMPEDMSLLCGTVGEVTEGIDFENL